jgi:hypothetical protein
MLPQVEKAIIVTPRQSDVTDAISSPMPVVSNVNCKLNGSCGFGGIDYDCRFVLRSINIGKYDPVDPIGIYERVRTVRVKALNKV